MKKSSSLSSSELNKNRSDISKVQSLLLEFGVQGLDVSNYISNAMLNVQVADATAQMNQMQVQKMPEGKQKN